MKIKDLIEKLQKDDPELPVVVFQDGGAEEVDRVGIYETTYILDWEKLGVKRVKGIVVGIGWPGNFEETEREEDCRSIKEL